MKRAGACAYRAADGSIVTAVTILDRFTPCRALAIPVREILQANDMRAKRLSLTRARAYWSLNPANYPTWVI